MKFTREQLEAYADDTLDKETYDAIDKEIAAGASPMSLIEDENIEESTDDVTPEVTPEVTPDDGDDEDKDRLAEEYKRAQQEREEAERKRQEEEIARLREELEEAKKSKEEFAKLAEENKKIEDKFKDIDDEYLDDATKRMKDLIIEQERKIAELEKRAGKDPRFDEWEREQEQRRYQEEQNRRNQEIIESLSAVTELVPDLKVERPMSELFNDYMKFTEEVATKLNLYDEKGNFDDGRLAQLESAYVNGFDGGEAKRLFEEKGITPPEELDKMIQITDYYNKANGIQYDRVRGKRKEYRLTPEQIYFLENQDKLITEARKSEQKKVADKLRRRNESAHTMNPARATAAEKEDKIRDYHWWDSVTPQQANLWKKTGDPRSARYEEIEHRMLNGEFSDIGI